MGKEEIQDFFCLVGDSLNFFYRNVMGSSLRFVRLLSKSVNSIGCLGGKKGQFL